MKTALPCLIVLVTLLAGRQPVRGQVPCGTFATVSASNAWMRKLRRQPLQQQLQAIRQRVQCDTVLRRREPILADQSSLAPVKVKRPEGTVLLYIIDEQHFRLNDAATASRFEQVLAKRHVRTIRYFAGGVDSAALFGSRGAEGTILLDSK